MARCLVLTLVLVLAAVSQSLAQQPTVRKTLKGHGDAICGLAFSPDGKLLASASQDETVRLWDVDTGENHTTLPYAGSAESVAFSPDGRTLASGGIADIIRLWDVNRGKAATDLKTSSWISSLAFSPDGKTLAAGQWGGNVSLWEAATGKQTVVLRGDTNALVYSVVFSPDGTLLAAAMGDGGQETRFTGAGIHLWSIATGREAAVLKAKAGAIHSIAFSADGKTLASGGCDNAIRFWNVKTGDNYATFTAIPRTSIAINPDGWRVASHEGVFLAGDALSVNSMVFSRDGKTLAAGYGDSTVRLWDVATRKSIAVLKGHSGSATVAFNPDGTILAAGSWDSTIKLWDVAALMRRSDVD